MADSPPNGTSLTGWGFEPEWAACERCGWGYLVSAGARPQSCPHCFATALTPVDLPVEASQQYIDRVRPPEQFLPFLVSENDLAQGIQFFSRGIPFAPPDLNPGNLAGRLQRLYLPLWLVDADVQATWQAEAGFDYQVVSHQDRYDDRRAGWASQEVKEKRVRWEQRLGSLKRSYANVPAPALEEESRLRLSLGDWTLQKAESYRREATEGTVIRLPDRVPGDAWQAALPAMQAAAGEECRLAARADHLRDFRWSPQFLSQNWTLLLRPVYTTYYLDDEGNPQAVLIHGQSGKVNGPRRASKKRGQRAAWIILSAALALFLVSLVFSAISIAFPPLLPLGGLGILVALLVALSAIIPVFKVWQFNRSQNEAPLANPPFQNQSG